MSVHRSRKKENSQSLGAFGRVVGRTSRPRARRKSADHPEDGFEELVGQFRLLDPFGRPCPNCWSYEAELCDRLDFEKLLEQLPEPLGAVADLLSLGHSLREISERLGVHRGQVRHCLAELAALLHQDRGLG